MAFHEIHSWTLIGLFRAFIDLAVVCFLLCVSATVFIPSKILKAIGVCFPCPCSGFYGIQNSDLCLHNLIVKWPMRRIYIVLDSVRSRFPFDLILADDQIGYSSRNSLIESHYANGIPQFHSESVCSAFSGQRLQNQIYKDSEYDDKEKWINQRPSTRIGRRRRAAFQSTKLSRTFLNDDLQNKIPPYFCFPCEGNETRTERESVAFSEREYYFPDDINESNHINFGKRSRQGFESSGSAGDNNCVDKGFASLVQGTSNALERGIAGNEASTIRLLEQALEEEKAARVALYLELEEERAAAATAADEAIAMISRLQNDKASIEMEARQYQRLIEEKFAYDEEEMSILRDILVRREIDNHVLEKEVEAYRQMSFMENEQPDRNWGYILDEFKEQYNGDPPVQHIENANSLSKMAKVNGSSSYNSPCLEKQCHLDEGLLKQTIWMEKDKKSKDSIAVSEDITTEEAPFFYSFDKNYLSQDILQENLEHIDQLDSGLQSSILDMEIDVQDIHVIDEKLHPLDKKEEGNMDK